MAHLWDAAYPNTAADPTNLDGFLVYIGGDTPHVWTDAEIAAAKGRYVVPVYVRSNPQGADPVGDAGQAIAWLRAHNAPQGITIVLDLETAVNAAYVNSFGTQIHNAGFKVLVYGSKSTIFQNPALDGYFVADYTQTDHVLAGSVATQYADGSSYDLDDITNVVTLWDRTNPYASEDDDMGALYDTDSQGIWFLQGCVYAHVPDMDSVNNLGQKYPSIRISDATHAAFLAASQQHGSGSASGQVSGTLSLSGSLNVA